MYYFTSESLPVRQVFSFTLYRGGNVDLETINNVLQTTKVLTENPLRGLHQTVLFKPKDM